MNSSILGTRVTPLLFVVMTLLVAAGCSGLTSASPPTAATHGANAGSDGGSSSGGNTGTIQATVSSTNVNFGSVTVGATITQKVQITNTGTTNVTITENAVSGVAFSASGIGSGLILNPAQLATLTIGFTPASAGLATGAVPLISDAWSGPMVITLSGTGIEAAPAAHVASLTWDASVSGVVGYNAYRGAQSGGPYTRLNSSLLSGTSYSDTTVASGQVYFYVVTSVDSLGIESDYSNQVFATIP